MSRIVDNLTGFPVLAGAVAAAAPLVLLSVTQSPMITDLYMMSVGLVPRWMLHGLAGYTVALAGEDQCGFLKGVGGGFLTDNLWFQLTRPRP